MKTKCNKCDKELECSYFSKNKNKKNGINCVCRSCHSEYRKNQYVLNKSREISQVKKYQKDNPEKYSNEGLTMHQKNTKAGRVIPSNCAHWNEVFISKKDFENSVVKYCSSRCRYHALSDPFESYCKDLKRRAKLKNLSFDLDRDFLQEMLEIKQENRCAVTGSEIKIKGRREAATLYETASIDRIDSSQGYGKNNVQWVLLAINYMKMNYSPEDLNKTLELIDKNRIRRGLNLENEVRYFQDMIEHFSSFQKEEFYGNGSLCWFTDNQMRLSEDDRKKIKEEQEVNYNEGYEKELSDHFKVLNEQLEKIHTLLQKGG
jgi:hypothetical protein